MMFIFEKRRLNAYFLIFTLALSNGAWAGAGSKVNLTNSIIEAMFKQTKPVCFGRFIIYIPATAVVNWGETHVDYNINSYPGSGAKISVETQSKIEEIKKIKHIEEPSALVGVFDGPNKDSKLVVGYEDFTTNSSLQLYSFIKLGKDAFVQKAVGPVLERNKATFVVDKNSYKKYVSKFQEIAGLLRSRAESEIPTVAGICIEAGFIPESNGKYHEMTSIGFSFPEYPDVRFSISTIRTNKANPKDSLEYTMKEAAESAGVFGMLSLFNKIKVLRKGERKIGDWAGAEQLSWMPPDEKGMPWTHEFKFKSIGVANDMFRPYIDMELSTGVSKNSRAVNEPSLKDDEAIALWDKLTASIKTRPTK
ncbi:T6SS immunity protein Tli4 family protein [Iodobacter sp.]|uniref:T6SS immunity protein Tli4 family protein n=1 Tax=Iodobacter sp. TaxID=1915058 RepID=UPI0025CF4AD0|nr:T6SS immunity protein Tli4 family protein [Iodobacter sp.]